MTFKRSGEDWEFNDALMEVKNGKTSGRSNITVENHDKPPTSNPPETSKFRYYHQAHSSAVSSRPLQDLKH